MTRKPKRSVPEILWRLYGNRARSLKDAIVDLITSPNTQPELCRCRGQGCLRCSRDKSLFLLRSDDPTHYRNLLHRCFVIGHEPSPPLVDFPNTSWWSQREIVERVIEMMQSVCDSQNVICARYDKYDQSSPNLELFTSSSWKLLLDRVGHDIMVYLLQKTSMFLPLRGNKYQQVSGPPLLIKQNETLSVHGKKRKRDDNMQPSKKRQRPASAVNDCPDDNSNAVTSIVSMNICQHNEKKTSKRSRLYLKRRRKQKKVSFQKVECYTPCISSCANGKDSTGDEADERNLHMGINESLTDSAKQAKVLKKNKHSEVVNSDTFTVIPPKHILKILRPNCSDSKLLMNHIFGEVNAWSAAPSQSKGNCPRGSLCLYHSLLKSLKSLIGKTKSSHLKMLLDKHCPVFLRQENALESAFPASQSSWRQNSDKLPYGSSSQKGKTKFPSVARKETKLYCTKDQIVSFIWAICRYIVPESLLGTTHQMRVLRKNIAWFVSMRKNEKYTVTQFLHRVKPSDFPLFATRQLCCNVNEHELQNESIRSIRQILCTKWISWLFVEIVKKLVLFNFYATESQEGRLNIYYYRKCSWERLISKELNKNLNEYVQVDSAEAKSRSKTLGLSKFRFIPKGNGVRMVLNFSASSRLQFLRDTHAVLKDVQLKEPDVLGSSVFDHDDFYRNLCPYLIHLRSQSGELPPLFFVVADVFKAYDSVDQDKLLGVIQDVLKDEYILNKCRLVSCGKRSNWMNNILVSSDKNATFSRFTSTIPCNSLQSIMVDQGENHLVRKKDLMGWIKNMLKNNILQLDKRIYVQIPGLPQGHRLSSLLCCFYFGHLERTLIYPFLMKASTDASAKERNIKDKKLITPTSYKLMRFIDDYLFVSTSRDQATSLYRRLKQGFPEYNCTMNENKFCINFDDEEEESRCSDNRMYVGDNGVSFVKWTGLLINSRTFEVQVDYTRYLSGHISSTFTVPWQNKPVRNLRQKMCYFLVPKCHPILFDSNINSREIVRLNTYQIFLLAAMKFHCYLYDLSRFWKIHPQALFRFIKKSIRYMFRLINRRMRRINTASNIRPVLKLHKDEVIWLGLHAYIQVLRKKNSRYRTLLIYLKSALSKQNLPQIPSPDLEYATDRSNSSALWKLRY